MVAELDVDTALKWPAIALYVDRAREADGAFVLSEQMVADVAHIDDVVTRMQNIAEHEQNEPEAVDVSALIEGLLEERRERITQRRLLVLRELERDAPLAWAEPIALRIALAGPQVTSLFQPKGKHH